MPLAGGPSLLPALAALAILLPCAPALAGGSELDQLLSRVVAAGAKTRTLQASFTQHKRLALFKQEVTTRGELSFRRPDSLRWETFAPDAALLLVDGQRGQFRVPGEPARRFDLRAGSAVSSLIGQVLFWFGVRPADELRRDYQLTLRRSAGKLELHLVPRTPALVKHLRSIDVELAPDLSPRRILVVQIEGDTTRIELGAARRNVPLPDKLFR